MRHSTPLPDAESGVGGGNGDVIVRVKKVELYGSDDRLLKEQKVNGVGTQLCLKSLSAGVYFVLVQTSAGVTTKRMVLQP